MKNFVVGIIPARMGASRFPGKPLALILNIPMLEHVYKRTKMSKALDNVYIATCDQEIVEFANKIGAPVIMTSDLHQRASSRCEEAMLTIEKLENKKVSIAVMIQGDEPLVTPEMIDDAVKGLLANPEVGIVNLVADIKDKEDYFDPNEIKVVLDENNCALYFSRRPIPHFAVGVEPTYMKKQVCIIPFLRDSLIEFEKMKPSLLEKIESVDMMRLLENGKKVLMIPTNVETCSVDNDEDLKYVEKLMSEDKLFRSYRMSSERI